MNQLQLDPRASFRLGARSDGDVVIATGSGGARQIMTCNDGRIVAWLLEFRRPRSPDEGVTLARRLLGVSDEAARQLVERFRRSNVLRPPVEDDPEERALRLRWERWGWGDALEFHEAIRDLEFHLGTQDSWSQQVDELGAYVDAAESGDEEASPGPYKEYAAAAKVALPRSRVRLDAASFGRALHARRTCRKFPARSLPLETFAELVEHSLGQTGVFDGGRLGPHVLRTSPSGGARHPVEVYPVVLRVEGLEPGLYHYGVESHTLARVASGDFAERVHELAHRQGDLASTSAVFFFTARWARHQWKYRYSRSYRMVLFDVAHLVQTQLLTATALGLQTFLTPAVRDTETAAFLGLTHDLEESPLYLTAVG